MTKWEYKVRYLLYPPDYARDSTERYLNDAGQEGWELVVMLNDQWAVFKRPKHVPIEEELAKMVETYGMSPQED